MKWLSNMLQAPSGNYSSKRVIGFICAMVLCVALFISMFTSYEPSKELVSSIEFITLGCLGFTSIDNFSKKKGVSNEYKQE